MCLPMKVMNPSCVLAEGVHAGHEWTVVHNGMGYRCGYVKVDPGHPWHGKGWGDVDVEVHGGVTFAEADMQCEKDGPDNGWWIGFDCAHSCDARDPELAATTDEGKYGLLRDMRYGTFGGSVKSQRYLERECISLC